MKTLNEILANLNEEQKQLLADTINHGAWGDADVCFKDNENAYGFGYITDLAYKGNHFDRWTLSNRFRSLFKALGLEGNKWYKASEEMCWMYDWWDDGTGSVLFIHETLYTEFEKWAKEYNK